jgi:hypothetical protein
MFLSSKHLITSTWRNMANLHIDCHNDNMSQQYLLLRVKVYLACTSCQNPKLTKIVELIVRHPKKFLFFTFWIFTVGGSVNQWIKRSRLMWNTAFWLVARFNPRTGPLGEFFRLNRNFYILFKFKRFLFSSSIWVLVKAVFH